ncbi:MAG: hypothetical protein H7Z15_10420 [Rhizobacter sp.]|nr:hypothetical protein [Rhizobacter sp.]
MKTYVPSRMALPLSTLAAALLLTACGGGEDNTEDTTISSETAQSVSANGMVLSEDAANANAVVLSTTQAVVAGGQASQAYACAGGGSALFTVSGGSVGSVVNGQLDEGETYSLQFTDCRGAAGAASVNGTMTLAVTTASVDAVSVNTSTQAIVVVLPRRTLTLNGSSTLARTVVTNGATVVTTQRWTSAQIALTSLRNARSSSLSLSNVDISRSATTTNGVLSGSSHTGTLTMALGGPNGSWTATLATQGIASYDANGVPLQGAWQMTLPHNRIGLQVGGGTATVTVDHGPDGTVDRSYTFSTSNLANEAV